VIRAVALPATASAGRTGTLDAAVTAGRARRFLCLAGGVLAKLIAASRCRAIAMATNRGALAELDLIIEKASIHHIGEFAEDNWPERVLQFSTGAAEYLILYTGT
jgi:hypothetical protein